MAFLSLFTRGLNVILGRLYFRSTALDIMSGGDIYAGSVGIDVQKVRKELFY